MRNRWRLADSTPALVLLCAGLGMGPTAARAADAPKPGEARALGQDQAEMRWAPGGILVQGAKRFTKDAHDDEKPAREVRVEGFWLDTTEVTNEQFAQFAKATGLSPKPPRTWTASGREKHPALGVTWTQAEAYCKWAGKRLPTESEWERAARGDDGRLYPWGNTRDASRAVGGVESTLPVGSRPEGAGPYGHLDLAGNAAEWTASWYERYPGNNYAYGDIAYGQKYRVFRGGSFMEPWENLRASARASGTLDYAQGIVGFRCALSP